MRNPKRLKGFYGELCRIHKEHFPDWRFGQFMSNFFGWLVYGKEKDIFFPEEDEMIAYLREYAGENETEQKE